MTALITPPFFCFLQTPCVIARSLRGTAHKFDRAHRCCSCVREKRRPWSRCLVSRKSEGGCTPDGHSFCGWSIFEPEDIGLSQAVVERSEEVLHRSKKATGSSRRPSPQRKLGGLSISRWPRVWTQRVPRTRGLLQQYCCVQQFLFFCHTWWVLDLLCRTHTLSEGARPTQGLIDNRFSDA